MDTFKKLMDTTVLEFLCSEHELSFFVLEVLFIGFLWSVCFKYVYQFNILRLKLYE